MAEDSLQKRYSYKLSTNLVALVCNTLIFSIIPRGLGLKAYGKFNFLTNFFTQAVGFFDAGTSLGFYTKLSKRPRESALVCFYVYFMALVAIVTTTFVLVARWTGSYSVVWPDQDLKYIYMAAGWGMLTWVVGVLNMMADAYGLTVSAETARIVQRVIGLMLILLLFALKRLYLRELFLYHYLILILLVGAFIWIMNGKGDSKSKNWRMLSWPQIRLYSKEFYRYSHPLFVYSTLAILAEILDRWLLQVFGGDIQQGLYSLSYRIGAICLLFTSAMTPLLMREFAISFGEGDLQEMARLFRRYVPMLYAIAAFFSCFVALQAKTVISIVGGHQFSGAFSAVTIMAFYPIHQTYGQLSASVYYAAGQTALYRNIGIVFSLIGVLLTYFLIAPKEIMGLGAGATGLAIKMVLVNIVAVNVRVYFNTRLLNLNYWRYLGHQILSLGVIMSVAVLAKQIVKLIFSEHIIVSFLVSGLVYSILVGFVVIAFPILFGLSKNDIGKMKNIVLERLHMRESRS